MSLGFVIHYAYSWRYARFLNNFYSRKKGVFQSPPQSSNPDGLYQPVLIIKFFLVYYLNLNGAFQWVMILSTSIDTLKILLTTRRKFISLHRNDDIVY